MLTQALVAGALAGLASVPHCAAMCGPLCAASCGGAAGPARQAGGAAGPAQQAGGAARLAEIGARGARYQAGRMLSYAFAGSIAGQLGALVEGSVLAAVSPLLLSLGVALALLLLAARLWRGASEPRVQLRVDRTRVGDGGGVPPKGRVGVFARLVALSPREPAILGGLSVLLPCGALAAGLMLAAATGDRLGGAALMGAFSLTSGAGVLAGGALLARLARIRDRRVGRALAIALALGAVLLGARPLLHARAADGDLLLHARAADGDRLHAEAADAAKASCH